MRSFPNSFQLDGKNNFEHYLNYNQFIPQSWYPSIFNSWNQHSLSYSYLPFYNQLIEIVNNGDNNNGDFDTNQNNNENNNNGEEEGQYNDNTENYPVPVNVPEGLPNFVNSWKLSSAPGFHHNNWHNINGTNKINSYGNVGGIYVGRPLPIEHNRLPIAQSYNRLSVKKLFKFRKSSRPEKYQNSIIPYIPVDLSVLEF